MIGQSISHYQILEKLGEGGMGVVYKARDTKLDRDVALKFLPPHLAASEQDKARFVQEAKAAAALNHPNVCSIIDIQEHDIPGEDEKQMFIVMEYVDGQTLRERTAGLPAGTTMSLKQAIDIGIQVADGLAAAHEKGIVHRDIKPENIMIRRDGIAQVMDFGLAKLRASGSKITRLTKQGSTVGTAGYMSPEQVTGQDADHRSDIFSLGVLLYELFTGELPFKGVHETALAYEIVNVDPAPMSVVKAGLDPALDAIVLECLAKDPPERYQWVAEVGKELRRFKRESSRKSVSRITAVRSGAQVPAIMPPAGSGTFPAAGTAEYTALSPASGTGRRSFVPWTVAVVFIALAGFFAWRNYSVVAPPPPDEIRLNVMPPPGASFDTWAGGSRAISPDGKMIAFVAIDSSRKSALYVRPLREESARKLPDTEDALFPFWSPDNRTIAFFGRGKLKKIDVVGGSPLTICDAQAGRGGTWNEAGVIIFSPGPSTGLSKVNATGGEVTTVTELDTTLGEITHRWPCFLPDGKRYLYLSPAGAASASESGTLYVGSLDSPERRTVLRVSSNVGYADGYLLYLRERTLMAHRFDADADTVIGDPFAIAENIRYSGNFWQGSFSVSRDGRVVFASGNRPSGGYNLKWYDRNGKEIGEVGKPGLFGALHLSPDGKKLAVVELDALGGNADIWIHDLIRGVKTRLTFDPLADFLPVWTPDGKQIIFTSMRDRHGSFYRKNAEGIGAVEPLYQSDIFKRPYSIPRDGNTLYFSQKKPDGADDLYSLPLAGKPEPSAVLKDNFDKDQPAISPDGKWLAYVSNESGSGIIYIIPIPQTGGRWQVTAEAAFHPLWSRDGKELFYLNNENSLMVSQIADEGGILRISNPQQLFTTSFRQLQSAFDVTPDGKRFIAVTEEGVQESSPMTVILNWTRPGENR